MCLLFYVGLAVFVITGGCGWCLFVGGGVWCVCWLLARLFVICICASVISWFVICVGFVSCVLVIFLSNLLFWLCWLH